MELLTNLVNNWYPENIRFLKNFLAMPYSMWDLMSPTRDRTRA